MKLEELEGQAVIDYTSVTPFQLKRAIQAALQSGLDEDSALYTSSGETLLWLEEMHADEADVEAEHVASYVFCG